MFYYVFILMIILQSINSLDRIVVIVRHGDRAPLNPYPFEQNKELWPSGYGHLTTKGKIRMYRIGLLLRRRYSRYFHNRYISPRDVYIRSSPMDRCLESAQLIAAGLSPPEDKWIWKKDLGEFWHPIPIYTVDKDRDGMLNPSSKCDRADRLYGKILDSPMVKEFYKSHEHFLQNLTSIIGIQELKNHRNVRELFDNLLCLKHHGYRLPKWAQNSTVYQRLKQIFDMSFRFDFTSQIEPELTMLRTGVLLKEIITMLNIHQYYPNNKNKLSIYVTHDSQLTHLQDALEMIKDEPRISNKFGMNYEFVYPNGSMMIFEQKQDSLRLLRINQPYYSDSFIPELIKLPIFCHKQNLNATNADGDDYNIPLNHFIQRYKHLFIENLDQWDKICSKYDWKSNRIEL